jgi:ketosteroid isomerase-like protein
MIDSDPEVDREQVLAVLDQEVAAIGNDDIKAYHAILADDAVFMPPNLPAKEGDELRRWLDDFLRGFAIQWLKFTHVETVVVSDCAYHVFACSWRVTPKAGGEPKVLHFKGLHILRRQLDGAWKLAREIWNTSPAAAATS